MKRTIAGLAAGISAVLALSACGGSSNPLSTGSTGSPSPSDTIVVGSANFPEDELLGEIYYQALTAKGVKATEKLNLGSREIYFPSLKEGAINLIPDYSGTLLQYLDKTATAVSSTDVYAALQKALPSNLVALDPASAEDKDAVVVTKATAQQYHATSIADLAPHCGSMQFGDTPEFITRVDGLPGLQKHYNCVFAGHKELDPGAATALALSQGVVQAADIFTTDASIAQYGFVVLTDPANNFAAQNVVPVITASKASAQVKQILNAISAKLDTATLSALNNQLNSPSKPDYSTVAKQWLTQVGLS